jgi:hypothetical protein
MGKRKSQDQFIRECKAVHGDKYDYSRVNYVQNKTPVIIGCPEHGDFLQIPIKHLNAGHGCPKCAFNFFEGKDGFIKKAKKIHGNTYNYSLVNYKNKSTPVKLICKKHGEFETIPHNHIWQKSGCPKCSSGQKSKPEKEWLDSLGIPHLERQKRVKINGKLYKFDGYDQKTNTVYELYGDFHHGNFNYFDYPWMNKMTKKSFGELYRKTMEREDAIKMAGYKLVTIWESEWMASKNEPYYVKPVSNIYRLQERIRFIQQWELADDDFILNKSREDLFYRLDDLQK